MVTLVFLEENCVRYQSIRNDHLLGVLSSRIQAASWSWDTEMTNSRETTVFS